MHPVVSEYELRVHDRRRQELVMNTVRQRAASALLMDATSPRGSRVAHRRGIATLLTLASGWLGRRRPQIGHPRPTRSTV